MTIPKRIQRRRTKGWRQPANTLFCGRPGLFGNPFDWRDYLSIYKCNAKCAKQRAVKLFDAWLDGEIYLYSDRRQAILDHLEDLRRYDYVSCWCSEADCCHVDSLLRRLSNERP